MPLGTIDINKSFNLAFPEDLGSDYYGHYMLFKIFTSDSQNVSIPTGAGTAVLSPLINQYNQAATAVNDVANSLGFGTVATLGPEVTQNGTYNKFQGQIGMYIPGGSGSQGMIFENEHEYADIRLSNLAGTMLGGSAGSLPAIAGGMIGRTVNPGVEVLYRTTKLRTFQFSYLMAPASQTESENLKSIIRLFRSYAAPEPTSNNLAYKTPAEFEIAFYNKGIENNNVPKIGRCVLERITVDYAPQGEWSTFRNGHPVAAMLTLTFQEMEIMTKPRIEAGY